MKYRACCEKRCLVHGCEIRKNGGCSCACSLNDQIHFLQSAIDGRTIASGCIYLPDEERRKKWFESLSPERKEDEMNYRNVIAPHQLIQAKKLMNAYIDNDSKTAD